MVGNKKIILKKKTQVYVLAPANTFTGGPDCLHKFAVDLKKIFRVNAKMIYLPLSSTNPIHKNFKKYKLAFANFIEDNPDNILIIPEHYMFLEYAMSYKKITKILWWLSIDNYFGYKFRYTYKKFFRSLIKIPFNILKIFNKITSYYFGFFSYHDYLKFIYKFSNLKKFRELQQVDLHLSQSYYAFKFLKKYFDNVKFLSDYQREEIIQNYKKKITNKKNLICYSNKSNDFIKSIQKNQSLKMIKLSGFSNKQIMNIFKKTKIYMDFGYHPGKDRMPREAALFNNCIITNKSGSAKNFKDIPIHSRFKFDEKKSNLKIINSIIFKIFKAHKKELKNFINYKKIILNEKKLFYRDLKRIFVKK